MHSFKPSQLIVVDGFINSEVYEIMGVYLGATNQCNLIGIQCVSESMGCANGNAVQKMFVPELLLIAALKNGTRLYNLNLEEKSTQ